MVIHEYQKLSFTSGGYATPTNREGYTLVSAFYPNGSGLRVVGMIDNSPYKKIDRWLVEGYSNRPNLDCYLTWIKGLVEKE